MAVDQEILDFLEGRELSVKDLALGLERSPAALYKPLARLVQSGLVNKREKLVKGKWVAFHGVPSEREIEGCRWESYKEILLAGKTYQKKVLEADFWPAFAEDVQSLELRQENRHIAVVGLVGWGKSTTGIWLARQLDSAFTIQDIIFVKQDLLKLVADQPQNKSFVLDDVGVMLSSRQWQEKERELIFNFLEICRMNQVNTIATAPSLAMIDVNYQRLLHYVLQVELKCKDHLHIIVFKPIQAGLKPSFKPVGTLFFPYPESVDHIVREYQVVKQKQLSLSARESLERLESAKAGVQRYVFERPVIRVTDDVVGSAVQSIGLDGNLSKQDRQRLRITMFDALEEKKQKEKAAKAIQVKQAKESLTKARLEASFGAKYQAYIDKGRSESFSRVMAYRLTFERSRAGNLKNLSGVMGSLFKKVKPSLVEKLILSRLDDLFLVRDLRVLRNLLASFKLFDTDFYSKIFAMFLYNPDKAVEFTERARQMRNWSQCYHHGKFSPKRWREGVLEYLASLEDQERFDQRLTKLGAGILGIVSGKPGLVFQVDQYKKPFWGDV